VQRLCDLSHLEAGRQQLALAIVEMSGALQSEATVAVVAACLGRAVAAAAGAMAACFSAWALLWLLWCCSVLVVFASWHCVTPDGCSLGIVLRGYLGLMHSTA
jgi:hypothetical protein